jgi:hypothetical protein
VLGLLLALLTTLSSLLLNDSVGCRPEPITEHTPTGVAGCVVYGAGTASMWPGPGVARNDCTFPWDDCTPITITALSTGRSVTVTPTMFCDCYTGTPNQRIVDLDPATVAALGLDPSQGLWPVTVQPLRLLPNTSMEFADSGGGIELRDSGANRLRGHVAPRSSGRTPSIVSSASVHPSDVTLHGSDVRPNVFVLLEASAPH